MRKHAKGTTSSEASRPASFWAKNRVEIILFLMCLLMLCVLLWQRYTAVHNWILYYSKDAVSGPLSPKEAAKHNAYYAGDESMLYLTFDCGYENGNTLTILDTLEEYDVPAAFFLTGTILKNNPEIVQALADSGHIIGNHTLTHPDPSDIHLFSQWKEQMLEVESLYQQITGRTMDKYCRTPEGRYSTQVLRWNKKLGYATFFWGVGPGSYNDWDPNHQPSAQEAMDTLMRHVRGGTVILLHNVSATSTQCLGPFIEACRARGYTFGSLEELCVDSHI